jgi:transcription termination/antitermination protein NusG
MQLPVEADAETMKWYVVKVQSNREKSIREAILRRIRRDDLVHLFGEIVIAVERVVDNRSGKKRITEQKLFPGYLMVQMILNDESWFCIRSVSGVGDFTGSAGKPVCLSDHEVARIVQGSDEKTGPATLVATSFSVGDKVKICDGGFDGFVGMIGAVDPMSGRVSVLIEIFGRPTPVDLESWQVESAA